MHTTPLHPDFGVEVHGVDLRTVNAQQGYPGIRELFETHSLLLFRHQQLDEPTHLALGRLFGPLEDRIQRKETRIAPVSNVDENGQVIASKDDLRLLNLQANFLWHTDSTFLPVPALANIIRAEIIPNDGGNTELVSTRAGFKRLSPELQERLRHTVFHHRYSHSRAKINPQLAEQGLFTMWSDQSWKAVWQNPVNGAEALYIASHVFAVEGMDEEAGQGFVDALIDAMTPPEAIYSHPWQPGDVLIWDERATLHRGTPWDYQQARRLDSICVSVKTQDGLEAMRPVH